MTEKQSPYASCWLQLSGTVASIFHSLPSAFKTVPVIWQGAEPCHAASSAALLTEPKACSGGALTRHLEITTQISSQFVQESKPGASSQPSGKLSSWKQRQQTGLGDAVSNEETYMVKRNKVKSWITTGEIELDEGNIDLKKRGKSQQNNGRGEDKISNRERIGRIEGTE